MSLFIVSTPIGNPKDLTARAADVLKQCETVIGEERSEVSKLLKSLGLQGKRLELLNEHSREEDLNDLLEFCREEDVALVSDCGTPGFCDPGAALVRACRAEGITVVPVPGASSLMALLAVSGLQLREFVFSGFLPANTEERKSAVARLEKESRAIFIMDTPYRLSKLLAELGSRMPKRRALLGLDLTQESEEIREGTLADLAAKYPAKKAEFVLLIHPLDGGNR
ncbi:MAG: SAM-dependent methyltransferase [Bdellovibrionia bacterium]